MVKEVADVLGICERKNLSAHLDVHSVPKALGTITLPHADNIPLWGIGYQIDTFFDRRSAEGSGNGTGDRVG